MLRMDRFQSQSVNRMPIKVIVTLFLSAAICSVTDANDTNLNLDGNFITIAHNTENLVYYKAKRSFNLKHWNPSWMPEFLGNGAEQSVLTLYPITVLEKYNFFVRVETGDPLQEFDPDDHAPIPILRYAPAYPSELIDAGIEGTVTALFVVSKEGRVSNIEIESSPDPRFNEAVSFVLQFWRFFPAEIGGEKVNVRVRIPIPFKIAQ